MVEYIGYVDLAHLHVVVEDLDIASEFYREVMGFIEMQSHRDLINRGLATYYGFGDEPENFIASLRFLTLPNILTLKLVHAEYKGYRKAPTYSGQTKKDGSSYSETGLGPISLIVKDLDATYDYLASYAQNYSSKFRIQLLSHPVFLSPLLPHQIGATEHSALYGQTEILKQIEADFPNRAKFQLLDPFGVRWEFNNTDVL